jgi:GxxExxY protein
MEDPRTHTDGPLLHEEITSKIIGAFFFVFDRLGFGFLEVVYRRALVRVLERKGVAIQCEMVLDVWFEGACIGHYKPDLVVDEKVVVQIKAVERILIAFMAE